MSMRQRIEEGIEMLDLDYDVVFLDGFDDAILGITFGDTSEPVRVVYSWNNILATLVERDGMTEDEAVEFFDYNIAGLNLPRMPIFVATPPGRHDA